MLPVVGALVPAAALGASQGSLPVAGAEPGAAAGEFVDLRAGEKESGFDKFAVKQLAEGAADAAAAAGAGFHGSLYAGIVGACAGAAVGGGPAVPPNAGDAVLGLGGGGCIIAAHGSLGWGAWAVAAADPLILR